MMQENITYVINMTKLTSTILTFSSFDSACVLSLIIIKFIDALIAFINHKLSTINCLINTRIVESAYKLSPKSSLYASARRFGQSLKGSKRPKKKRSTFGSSTKVSPPINLRFSYNHANLSAVYIT